MTFYKTILAAGALALTASAADAATLLATVSGNDPFPKDLEYGDITTPAIYKCDGVGDNEGECTDEAGPALGSGSFILSFFEEGDGDDYSSFTWEFVAGDDGLAPHYIAVKAGNEYDLWMLEDGEVRGTLSTISGKSTSHVSFYNTGVPNEIPVPAAGFLLLAGLGGLAALRRRT